MKQYYTGQIDKLSEKLMPCPFCGGVAVMIWNGHKKRTIKCTECHVTKKQAVLRLGVEQLESIMVKWWNGRCIETAYQTVSGALKDKYS